MVVGRDWEWDGEDRRLGQTGNGGGVGAGVSVELVQAIGGVGGWDRGE